MGATLVLDVIGSGSAGIESAKPGVASPYRGSLHFTASRGSHALRGSQGALAERQPKADVAFCNLFFEPFFGVFFSDINLFQN
jgi:hypothetical protein